MYELNQIINGITKYMDNEILTNVTGWQKWVFGASYGVGMSKATSVFNALKENQIVKMLGIIDGEDKIDIDTLHKEFLKQSEKGSVTFDVPMLGALTLKTEDVDKLYTYIKG